MTLFQLALKDVARNEFRSWVVFLSAALVAGLVVASGLLVVGASDSLRRTQQRLGADLLVVPRGTAPQVENALLMGAPASAWMPLSTLDAVRGVRGVSAASPQVYLASLAGASCCSVSNMFIVAFDPATDFTVQPWLGTQLKRPLKLGEAVGGALVSVPAGEGGLKIYGYTLSLASKLEPTGSNLDQSLFLTFETAREVARKSKTDAVKPLVVPQDKVSSVLVKVDEGVDPQAVAAQIAHDVPGTSVVLSPQMFDRFQGEIGALSRVLLFAVGLTIGLSLVLIGLVFSMAAHERRREVGIWRALGATRSHVVSSFVLQAGGLSLFGGIAGVTLSVFVVYLFHDYLVNRLGVPITFPAPASFALLVLGGLTAAVGVATLASALPASRASRQDPAQAMRE